MLTVESMEYGSAVIVAPYELDQGSGVSATPEPSGFGQLQPLVLPQPSHT